MKKIAIVLFLALASVALASGIVTSSFNAAGNTAPSSNTDGVALQFAGTSDPGQAVTRVKVTLKSTGSFSGGYVQAWRFVKDAGWARDQANDFVIADAGATGAEIITLPDITYNMNGNSSRAAFQTARISYTDAGTAVPTIITEAAAR